MTPVPEKKRDGEEGIVLLLVLVLVAGTAFVLVRVALRGGRR